MNSEPVDLIPRSRLYELLVQVDRKLAVVESRVENIEKQMSKQFINIEREVESSLHHLRTIQYGIIAVLIIGGLTMLVMFLLLWTGRL